MAKLWFLSKAIRQVNKSELVLIKATQILHEISAGDLSQRERLFREVYDDFRRLAQEYVAREGPRRDLQATDVVHEVYLRLIDQTNVSWKDRSHFFATGARIMRHVLVDNARKRLAQKRGGGGAEVSIDLVDHLIRVSPDSDADVLSVHNAIENLARSNERRAQLVELRFFGGLTMEESAEAVGVSTSTAEREWRVAKAWLRRELSQEE